MGESIYRQLNELAEKVSDRLLDAQKFDEGNNTAGSRVTKMLNEVQKDAKALKMEIFNRKKS